MARARVTVESAFVEIAWRGRPLRIEHGWVGNAGSSLPNGVFLHQGLGSVATWKDFPQRLCEAHGLRGLVFSRYGYGQSTAKAAGERWPVDFMHRQAFEVLPPLLAALGLTRPWLFGHSDGGSIALLHASRFPVAGLVLLGPRLV